MSLFYREIGTGLPFVILHGLYGSSDNWQPIAKLLSNQYRIITVDLRNHGASPHSNSNRYSDMVSDLAWLFHELKIEKAQLLGHSMGGKVAIAFAADYPEMISSLMVADIAPKNYLKTPASAIQYDFHKRILETLSQLELKKYESRKEIEQALEPSIPEMMVRRFILKNLHRVQNNFEWKINVPVLKKELDHILSGVDVEDYSDRIPIIQYPVLFIKGELSGYIQPDDVPNIKRMYPEVKIEILKNTTHLLHAERPKEFTEIVKHFTKHAL